MFASLQTGVWLLASLNSHGTTKGMRVKFQDVECYRDYQYDYSDEEVKTKETKEFSMWNPASLDDIRKEEEKPKPVEQQTVETDMYTDMFAEELGLRSRKNQSTESDVEELDLSFLEYDVIDVPDRGINISLNSSEAKRESETPTPKPNTLKETLFSFWKEVDGIITTVNNLLSQRNNENTTYVEKESTESIFNNSSSYKTENETLFSNLTELNKVNLTVVESLNRRISENTTHAQNGSTESTFNSFSSYKTENISLKNNNASDDVSNPHNVAMSDKESTKVHNATASSVVGNVSTELTSLTVTLPETNLTLKPTTNLTSILVEDSEAKFTRGDVFYYSVPLANSDLHNVSVISLSKSEDENKTATNNFNVSADTTNHSLSIPTVNSVNISSTDRHNLTAFELEMTDHKTSDNDSLRMVQDLEYGLQMDSSEVLSNSTNSGLQNLTHIALKTQPLQNITQILTNSSEENSSESRENVTALVGKFNHTSSVETSSSEITLLGNLSLSNSAAKIGTYEDLGASDSSSEVFIYLKENNTEVIKTTSVKTQGHNWTYEGTHQMVPMDIPDHMTKYFENETHQKAPAPKKKTVTVRQRPQKGQGMKTKRRKQYKPQARSGLPFSPRGFNPGMTPRGSRPHAPKAVSDEEELINMPVVIGVPRAEFSDYELYVPGDQPDHLDLNGQDVTANEYEYVSYKDPYSGHADIKNLNLDETTKYYLKYSGLNVKTYFITAEEVEWDYAGYGQR